MEYYSTQKKAPHQSFMEAMHCGLAPDGGLYMPDQLPDLSESFWEDISGLSLQEIGFRLSRGFIDEVTDARLREVISKVFPFDAPLVRLDEQTSILELFHGPTLAFKDFGARFMAQLMGLQVQKQDDRLVILVATSGDTGSAVGRAFEGIKGIDVVLLYPSGKVSELQEKQLTTIGGNVTALEVNGVFDDCQKLVKQAFSDKKLGKHINLSSANSINIARLLPQMFYYGRALAQYNGDRPVHFCVPSGNFGNLTAGLMSAKTGMPVRQFLAATNANDVVPRYLKTGTFDAHPSQKTISNAMDVGDPSNFERMQAMYPTLDSLKEQLWSASFTDDETREAIQKVYQDHNYIVDPHTAVGYCGMERYRREFPDASGDHYIVLATAHPAKFSDEVEPLIEQKIVLPESLKQSLQSPKRSTTMAASYRDFKQFLREKF